jgi:hypothetical protein
MTCVILQPSYIPWRGYFHQIAKADCFIFLDDVQYDKRSWRNRNRIKTPQGPRWLTIPVHAKGCQVEGTLIRDIRICPDTPWAAKHWNTLEQAYRKTPFFELYAPLLKTFYGNNWEFLSDLTIEMTMSLARELGIRNTVFLRSSSFKAEGSKTDRLVSLLGSVGATHYLTGPAARAYLEETKLLDAGITLEYVEYSFKDYPQLYPPFEGNVSILDLLFMKGPEARRLIRSAPEVLEDEEISEMQVSASWR